MAIARLGLDAGRLASLVAWMIGVPVRVFGAVDSHRTSPPACEAGGDTRGAFHGDERHMAEPEEAEMATEPGIRPPFRKTRSALGWFTGSARCHLRAVGSIRGHEPLIERSGRDLDHALPGISRAV